MTVTTPVKGPAEIVSFWVQEVGPQGWYAGGDDLDDLIRHRFLALWQGARGGGLRGWLTTPEGVLGALIVTDQFPRNMFRGEGRAFATDALARSIADKALFSGWDMQVPEPQRQFFYLPFMHAETNADQARSVRLLATRMPETGADNLLHARAHRAVIRRYGRFPYRNAALGRQNTPAEVAYLAAGGYGSTVAELRAAG